MSESMKCWSEDILYAKGQRSASLWRHKAAVTREQKEYRGHVSDFGG